MIRIADNIQQLDLESWGLVNPGLQHVQPAIWTVMLKLDPSLRHQVAKSDSGS